VSAPLGVTNQYHLNLTAFAPSVASFRFLQRHLSHRPATCNTGSNPGGGGGRGIQQAAKEEEEFSRRRRRNSAGGEGRPRRSGECPGAVNLRAAAGEESEEQSKHRRTAETAVGEDFVAACGVGWAREHEAEAAPRRGRARHKAPRRAGPGPTDSAAQGGGSGVALCRGDRTATASPRGSPDRMACGSGRPSTDVNRMMGRRRSSLNAPYTFVL
jgi:hypothetical protein